MIEPRKLCTHPDTVTRSEFHDRRRRRSSSSKSQRKRKRSSSGKNNNGGNKSGGGGGGGAPSPTRKCDNKEEWDGEPPPKIEHNPICDTNEDEVIPRSPVEAADCPFDMDDGDDLVIDEGDDDVVDVGHAATDELFSPVIVSTCSLNKKEGDSRRSSSEDERPRSQSDESSKARHFLSYVGVSRGISTLWRQRFA